MNKQEEFKMAIITGTKENFKDLAREGVVLVDFNADWCGPCQMMKPIFEEVAEGSDVAGNEEKQKDGGVKFVSVNIDDEEELAEEFEVSTIPTFVLLIDGEEKAREIGVISKKKLQKMLEKA